MGYELQRYTHNGFIYFLQIIRKLFGRIIQTVETVLYGISFS